MQSNTYNSIPNKIAVNEEDNSKKYEDLQIN